MSDDVAIKLAFELSSAIRDAGFWIFFGCMFVAFSIQLRRP